MAIETTTSLRSALRRLGAASSGAGPLLLLLAWALHHHRALAWITRSWRDATYDSWGVVPLVVVAGLLVARPPQRRERPSGLALGAFAGLAALELFLAPLGINGLSALLALASLALWGHAHWHIRRGLATTLLLLLTLPLLFWADVLLGHHLQRLATRGAAALLSLYGLDLRVEGTVMSWGSQRFAVDAACSGLRMALSALVLALFMQPTGLRRILFWPAWALAVVAANVSRVTALALLTLGRGAAPSEALHQAMGLVCFALLLGPLLLWGQRRRHRQPREAARESEDLHPRRSRGDERGGRLPPALTIAICLTLLMAGARQLRGAPPASAARAPHPLVQIPAHLAGKPGKPLDLGPADAALQRRENVRIERRRYGRVEVALSSVYGGIREHHPPSVCLRASGYEITRQRTRRVAGHCLVEFSLRRGDQRSSFAYTYYDGEESTCSLWSRVADAAWGRLSGAAPKTWTTLQVLAPCRTSRASNASERQRRPKAEAQRRTGESGAEGDPGSECPNAGRTLLTLLPSSKQQEQHHEHLSRR